MSDDLLENRISRIEDYLWGGGPDLRQRLLELEEAINRLIEVIAGQGRRLRDLEGAPSIYSQLEDLRREVRDLRKSGDGRPQPQPGY